MVRSSARSYYELLSVAASADGVEIERAFRRCCFIIFCDQSNDLELADRLLPVAEAYHVLSQPHLRHEYDRDGECSLDPAELHCRAVGERDAALVRLRPAMVVRNGEGWIRGVATAVTAAADLLRGTTRSVRVPCTNCDGVGWLPIAPLPCPTCSTTAPSRRALSPVLVRMGVQVGCGGCYDRGFIGERACPACSGLGTDPDGGMVSVTIPAGTAPGAELQESVEVLSATRDLPVIVLLEPDPRFRSEGADLVADFQVSAGDLIGGRLHRFEGITETLDVSLPKNAHWGQSLRIPGAGLPLGSDGSRGDLVLKLVARRQILMPPERKYRRKSTSALMRRIRGARRAVGETANLMQRRFHRRRTQIAAIPGIVVRRPSVAIAAAALVLTAGAAVGALARGPRPPSRPASAPAEELAAGAVVATGSPIASAGGGAAPTGSSAATVSGPVRSDASGARIVAVHGAGQTGSASTPLADSIVVRLVDGSGEPVAHQRVSFVVLTGRGRVAPRSAVTDSRGVVRTRWTLGPTEPLQAIAAMAEDNSIETVVTARLAGAAAARAAVLSGADQSAVAGASLARPIQVRVEDRSGHPAPGVRVTFRPGQGGAASPAEITTNAQGVARTQWRLGPQPGEQHLSIQPDGIDAMDLSARALSAPLQVHAGIATGGTHTCRLGAEGTLTCWGGNASGQLGDGGSRGRSDPTVAEGHIRFAVVAGGVSHTCAISADGAAYCWGAGAQGQLGNGRFDNVAEPQEVEGGPFTAIAAGSSHSCALDADGLAYCWGGNEAGQLGDGSTRVAPSPRRVAGDTRFSMLALGWSHSCALDQRGLAQCWGRNALGQLGTGDLRDRSRPAFVAGGHTYRTLVAGSAHTCGLGQNGVTYCWGHDDQGQLGSGSARRDHSTPVPVAGSEHFVRLTAGSVHTCGLTADGSAYCWGGNTHGQLGDGTTTSRASPVAVLGGHHFRAIHASGAHTCATGTDARDYCWGYNMEGQLGDGTRTSRSEPTPVTASARERR